MEQVLERQKSLTDCPFSSFSLLSLLDGDSINELVGGNVPCACPALAAEASFPRIDHKGSPCWTGGVYFPRIDHKGLP